jgi:hypothetical protein
MFGGGNQGDARQKAHEQLKAAERAGVKGKDLDTLKAQYNAAVARENSAKGTPGQRRS